MRISTDKMETYRVTARQSWVEERRRLALRHERAWVIARQAADLLRREYGVDRVILFGSLVRSELFHARSDIDLAVQAMPPWPAGSAGLCSTWNMSSPGLQALWTRPERVVTTITSTVSR